MNISWQGKILVIDGQPISLSWPILQAVDYVDKVFVLFDPDSYLSDQQYTKMRRQGAQAIRNLVALTRAGEKLWEAEFPETADYYYQITSISPLVANSFSSYRCEIDPTTGRIRSKAFLK